MKGYERVQEYIAFVFFQIAMDAFGLTMSFLVIQAYVTLVQEAM